MGRPEAPPRSPEDLLPRGGIQIEQEINAIRYELLVRHKGRKVWVVIRTYDDEDQSAGISVRYTAP